MNGRYNPPLAAEFDFACAIQGVRLHEELAFDASDRLNRVYKLASAIGIALSKNSQSKLATNLIERPVLQCDYASGLIRSIINSSMERSSPRSSIPYFPYNYFVLPRRCSRAESSLASSFDEMLCIGSERGLRRCGGEVYVDEDGAPVIFRKSLAYSSGISLTQINIGGIEFPTGSLLYVDDGSHNQEYNALDKTRLTVRPIADIQEIAFARLTAFASPADQRYFDNDVRRETGERGVEVLNTLRTDGMQVLVSGAIGNA